MQANIKYRVLTLPFEKLEFCLKVKSAPENTNLTELLTILPEQWSTIQPEFCYKLVNGYYWCLVEVKLANEHLIKY